MNLRITESVVKDWCKRINIEYDERIVPYYLKGTDLYNEKKFFVVDKKRLNIYNAKYNIFRKWFDDVLLACDDLMQQEDLIIYIYTLIEIITAKDDVEIIKAPDLNCRATDFAPLFSFLYFLDDMISEMMNRGCTNKIISDTLNVFDSEMDDYYKTYGRSGMRIYIAWFMYFLEGKILRVGRLQYEIKRLDDKIRVFEKDGDVKILIDGEYMHKKGMVFGSALQTEKSEKYYADILESENSISGYAPNEFGECVPERITLTGYKEILKNGDYVLSVHIPSDGSLEYDLCEESYIEAQNLYAKYYSEYDFKAFTCSSWLMEKRLKEIIGKETNITKFAGEFVTYPLLSTGTDVYVFLYNLQTPQKAETLPENTSMRKMVKKYLMEGNAFYKKGGIRLFKNGSRKE